MKDKDCRLCPLGVKEVDDENKRLRIELESAEQTIESLHDDIRMLEEAIE